MRTKNWDILVSVLFVGLTALTIAGCGRDNGGAGPAFRMTLDSDGGTIPDPNGGDGSDGEGGTVPTPTPSPTASPSDTPSPSSEPTPEPSASPTATPSPSPSDSPNPTASPSPSPTSTPGGDDGGTIPDGGGGDDGDDGGNVTPSPTPSAEPTPTPSGTPEPTASPSPTVAPTPSPSVEPSPTASPDPTASPTPSASPSPDPGDDDDGEVPNDGDDGDDDGGNNPSPTPEPNPDHPGCPVTVTPIEGAIYVLDRDARGALDATGNAEISTDGDLFVASRDAAGLVVTGNGIVRAADVHLAGSYSLSGGNARLVASAINTNVSGVGDPLQSLLAPVRSQMTPRSSQPLHFSQGSHALQPGLYVGGISVSGKASVTLEPGIYYIDGGGFSFTGQGSLGGQGVMIYNVPTSPSDAIRLAGNKGDVTLTAPTSGRYRGIAVFQARSADVTVSITGHGSLHLQGAIYAANATVKVAGRGDEIGRLHISRRFSVHGNGTVNVPASAGPPPLGCQP